jgi:hypothetical protein
MSRFAALVHVLPFSVGLLTGCTTLVTSYNMVRAEIMNSQEPKDESQNYYGAFFISAASLASGRPTEGSEPILRQYPEAKGRLSRRMLRLESAQKEGHDPKPILDPPKVMSAGYPAQRFWQPSAPDFFWPSSK